MKPEKKLKAMEFYGTQAIFLDHVWYDEVHSMHYNSYKSLGILRKCLRLLYEFEAVEKLFNSALKHMCFEKHVPRNDISFDSVLANTENLLMVVHVCSVGSVSIITSH